MYTEDSLPQSYDKMDTKKKKSKQAWTMFTKT